MAQLYMAKASMHTQTYRTHCNLSLAPHPEHACGGAPGGILTCCASDFKKPLGTCVFAPTSAAIDAERRADCRNQSCVRS